MNTWLWPADAFGCPITTAALTDLDHRRLVGRVRDGRLEFPRTFL